MIIHGYTTVTTPGTAVPLSTTRQEIAWLTVFPRKVDQTTNSGAVRVGGQPLLNRRRRHPARVRYAHTAAGAAQGLISKMKGCGIRLHCRAPEEAA